MEPLVLHADLVDDYKSKELLGYTISSFGYGGRYVLWRKEIPKNTTITIKKAFVYGKYFFSDYTFSLDIEDSLFNLDSSIPIYLYTPLTHEENGYIVLDPKFLREIK